MVILVGIIMDREEREREDGWEDEQDNSVFD